MRQSVNGVGARENPAVYYLPEHVDPSIYDDGQRRPFPYRPLPLGYADCQQQKKERGFRTGPKSRRLISISLIKRWALHTAADLLAVGPDLR